MPDILILAGVSLLVVFLVRKLVKDHKQGGCASCPHCSACMKSREVNSQGRKEPAESPYRSSSR